jgi:hypothetical protein
MTPRTRGIWLALGCTALGAYFVLFNAGLLLSSRPYREQLQAEASRAFRRESPFASMFRSFLVYPTFMAGIFITTEKPFEAPTVDQYARLAGMLSLFGFVVGYDPTKFQDFIDMVPRRGKGGA